MDTLTKSDTQTNNTINNVDSIITSLSSQVSLLKERLSEEREEHKEIYAKQKQEIEVLKLKIDELEKIVLENRLNKKFTLDDESS
jgi:cell shape-determining protein MreC